MCNHVPVPEVADIPMPDQPWFDDLEAEEVMEAVVEEVVVTSPHILSCSNTIYKGMCPDNLATALDYYDDIFLTDIHLTSTVHNMYDVSPPESLCCVGCSDNANVYTTSSEAHMMFHMEEFKEQVLTDMEYCTNQFFCYYCRQFLYDTTDEEEEFCESCLDVHNEYFKSQEVNSFVSIM